MYLDVHQPDQGQLGAPVVTIHAPAVEAVRQMISSVNPYGLHFAFLDPYNLGALDFTVISALGSAG